jgi:hypothetical protein
LSATSPSSLATTQQPLSIPSALLPHHPPNFFPLKSLTDPHPLNSAESYRYINIGGRGPILLRTSNFLASLSSIHPLSFQYLTHSFPQRTLLNSFGINSLRTLSITTGVYPPLSLFLSSVSTTHSPLTTINSSLVFSYPCALSCRHQNHNAFIFTQFHAVCANQPGVGGTALMRAPRFAERATSW